MRANGLKSLLNAAHIPEVWSTLNDLKTAPLLPDQKREIERQLVYSVDRGNPHDALNYLESEIMRTQAIAALDQKKPKREIRQRVAKSCYLVSLWKWMVKKTRELPL